MKEKIRAVIKISEMKFKEINKTKIIYICIMVLVLFSGLYFRINNYLLPISFHVDEVQRARYLNWENGLEKSINRFGSSRPIGYLILSKILNEIKSTEPILRLTSVIPSLFSIYISVLLTKKLYKHKTAILFVLILLMFNPYLITFSNVFKHYSLEVFLHLLLIYFSVDYITKPNRKKIIIICCVLPSTLLFAGPNIVFLFPSVFLILLFESYRNRDFKNLIIVIASGVICLVFLLLLYTFFWKKSIDIFTSTWDAKYGGYPIEGTNPIIWQLKQLFLIGQYLLNYPSELISFSISKIFLVFSMMGVISLIIAKSYRYFILLLLPLFPLIIANIMRYWPLGVDRTNLFLVIYFILLIGFALDFLQSYMLTKHVGLLFFILSSIYLLSIRPNYYEFPRSKYGHAYEDIRSALNYLTNDYSIDDNSVIYLNPHGWMGFEYYVHYHDLLSETYSDYFRNKTIETYSKRDNEYVINMTKDALRRSKENSVFLFYHYDREASAFFSTLDKYTDYELVEFSGAVIVKIKSLNNQLLNNVDYKAIPGSIFEAEDCKVSNMRNLTDELKIYGKTSGKYIVNADLSFFLIVNKTGTYRILIKTIAENDVSDSWYVSVNGEERFRWNIPHSNEWTWNMSPCVWTLEPGVHKIDLIFREPTPIDEILIIKD